MRAKRPTTGSSRVLMAGSLLLGILLSPQAAQAQLPAITKSALIVELEDYLVFPNTRGGGLGESGSTANNIARINFAREVHDGRWFVNDLRGYLYSVDPHTKAISPYLNIRPTLSGGGSNPNGFEKFVTGGGLSTGFVTTAFHPEFATNGRFFTLHVESASGNAASPDLLAKGNTGAITHHSVLTEWTATNPAANAFSGSRREMLRVGTTAGTGSPLHNLGDLAFNPHATPGDADYGMLYIAAGDGGYDAYARGDDQSQRLDSVFGKILRIDPAGNNSANGKYGIPTDNPFFSSAASPSPLKEVYASGFRNPHRIMWDPAGGEALFTTDIGHNHVEEVNLVQPGNDYGWSLREGTFNRGGGALPTNAGNDGLTYPVAQYDHGDGDAIAGGFAYRGTLIPQLSGKYVFGDIVEGRIFYAELDELYAAHDHDPLTTAAVHELQLIYEGLEIDLKDIVSAERGGTLPNGRVDLRLIQDAEGELYLITKQDGHVRALVPEPSVPALFAFSAIAHLRRRRR